MSDSKLTALAADVKKLNARVGALGRVLINPPCRQALRCRLSGVKQT